MSPGRLRAGSVADNTVCAGSNPARPIPRWGKLIEMNALERHAKSEPETMHCTHDHTTARATSRSFHGTRTIERSVIRCADCGGFLAAVSYHAEEE